MNRKKIIGIPIKNLEDPMSRLSEVLTKDERVNIQKELIHNIVKSFKNNDHEIYLISTNKELEILADILNVKIFKSNSAGLNNEVIEFSKLFSNYDGWIICHADLPYLTKHFANIISTEVNENEILIAKSKDNGTPLIAGTVNLNKFLFGKNSFNKHIEYLREKKYVYKQIFSTEFTFELDDADDYKKFIQNQPRWFRKLNA
ncbi:MAG: hypothetical protein CL493_00120 [Actinobacteria bacterium]|nr:hypothetical protein [Actinomycetota bacterium]